MEMTSKRIVGTILKRKRLGKGGFATIIYRQVLAQVLGRRKMRS